MARGTTLATLRAMLKAEVGDAQETNMFADTEYNYLLAAKQQDLANMFDWSFLKHVWDLTCGVSSRYLDLPTADIRGLTCAINFERPVLVERYYDETYQKIDFGIGTDQMNVQNSDLSEAQDPIQRWQLSTNTNESSNPSEVEIWPMPVTAQKVRFSGQRVVQALVSDTDKADLDDLLIVYYVAAERLLLRKQASAQYKLRQAEQHLLRLRAGYPVNECPIVFGQNLQSQRQPRPIVVVAA